MIKLTQRGWFWVFIFLGVFLLSQDYLFTTWASPSSFLGFPAWLGWFGLLHLVFIAVFYWFAKTYWRE